MKITANNYKGRQSSCYYLDMRNSTSIIRYISRVSKNETKIERLDFHAQFMMNIHTFLMKKLKELDQDKFYFDNTGDGHLCLLWNEIHAWTMIDLVCSLSIFLEQEIKKYNNQLEGWIKEPEKKIAIDFGIGIHTAGSLYYRNKELGRDFAYGIVLNSAARTESFTKNFNDIKILISGNFRRFLGIQYQRLDIGSKRKLKGFKDKIKAVTQYRSDVKDNSPKGHLLYTIESSDWKYFTTKRGGRS